MRTYTYSGDPIAEQQSVKLTWTIESMSTYQVKKYLNYVSIILFPKHFMSSFFSLILFPHFQSIIIFYVTIILFPTLFLL